MSAPVGATGTRLRRRSRLVALLGAAALLAAACSTTSDDDGASATPLPGIDAASAKVGFLVVDLDAVAGNFGFEQADYGGVPTITKGIQAIVDAVNADGGAGGRQLEAEIVPFDGSVGTPEQSQQLCADLTQDRGVFAAIVDGQYHSNVVPCYSGANTLMMDLTFVAHDQAKFEQHAPYLWAPSVPEYSSFLQAELDTLREDGFLEAGQRVQLLTADDEVARRAASSIAKPFLEDLGASHVQTDFIDVTNTGTIGASAKSAIQSGKSGNIDRVVTVGGARILSIALADFEARDYSALWSMSTFDNPLFVQDNNDSLQTERRPGMVGIGYNPAADVSAQRGPEFPDPNNSTQQRCYDILNAADAAPPADADGSLVRDNWRLILGYCDSIMLLDAALDNVGSADEVSAQDFAAGAAQIGDALPAAVGFSSNWSDGVYSGINTAQKLAWDEGCECFQYEGDLITFGAPVELPADDPAAEDGAEEDTAGTDTAEQ